MSEAISHIPHTTPNQLHVIEAGQVSQQVEASVGDLIVAEHQTVLGHQQDNLAEVVPMDRLKHQAPEVVPTAESRAQDIADLKGLVRDINSTLSAIKDPSKKGPKHELPVDLKRDWKTENQKDYIARLTKYKAEASADQKALREEQKLLAEQEAKNAAEQAAKEARQQEAAEYKERVKQYNESDKAHREALADAEKKARFKANLEHGSRYVDKHPELVEQKIAEMVPHPEGRVAELDGSVAAERRAKREAATSDYVSQLKAVDRAMMEAATKKVGTTPEPVAAPEVDPSPAAHDASEDLISDKAVPPLAVRVRRVSGQKPDDQVGKTDPNRLRPTLVEPAPAAAEQGPQSARERLAKVLRGAKQGLAAIYAGAGVRAHNAQTRVGGFIESQKNLGPEEKRKRRRLIAGVAGVTAVTGVAYVVYKTGHGHHALAHHSVAPRGAVEPHDVTTAGASPNHLSTVPNPQPNTGISLNATDGSFPWTHIAKEVGPGNATNRITELVTKANQHGWRIIGNGQGGGHGAIASVTSPDGSIYTDNGHINAALDIIAGL